LIDFDVFVYFPTGQAIHTVNPAVGEYVPGKQDIQEEELDRPVTFPCDPVGHNFTLVEFIGQYPPSGHTVLLDGLGQ
jgi:hypothetical protein